MGIFDMETGDDDPPAALVVADEAADLLIVTSLARAFRLPLKKVPETPVRGRGQPLADHLPLDPGESVALVLPHRHSGYLNVITNKAQVRRLRHHFFGDNMTPGNLIYDTRALGRPLAACWSNGSGDIFIATRQGKAIRFAESLIPAKGCLGIRLSDDDAAVSIAGVNNGSGIFLLTADGKGTIRLMSGFSANKAPGAGGKVAIKADNVAGAIPVNAGDDIFAISRLSKIIRFQAEEIPPKEGVVQGVNCMALRADETVALVAGEVTNEI
jgi:DNA gyrase subunit A